LKCLDFATPDMIPIYNAMLASNGFKIKMNRESSLGCYFDRTMNNLKTNLSKRKWYDFGLRAIKFSIVPLATKLRKEGMNDL